MLLIDTATVPAPERLDFWSESAFDAYLPVQIRSAAKEEFGARMWGYELGPLSLFRIAAAANTMMRTSRAIAACDPECLHLSVVLRGRLNAAQEGRTAVARIGDMISYETSHPVIFRADLPFESLVVRVPRQMLGREATLISNLTAVRISGNEGLPRAAVAFFRGLVGGLEDGTVTPADAPNAVECVLDLVRGLYTAPAAHEPTRLRSRAEILLHIQSFIEANLGDPHLDPEEIARASFISTRYLHKLFEAEGTTVCRWIRASRLERCRRDLLDPALAHETVLAIASRWGLPSPQHFSRLFRSAYGCSPTEFRRDAHWHAAAVPKILTALPAAAG
jgi:AraC-like DNA-binding protein